MSAITKVLIANRGEIAVRIIRAAQDRSIKTVAIYSDQDRNALHARYADEAYALHGTTAAQTYLSIDKIIAIAQRSTADAIHPGYGFLSENPDFARAVIDAGLIWIGPSPETIELLGNKVSARQIAEKAGAPLAPGTLNPVAEIQEIHDFVEHHGLPIAIKAAYGGGGRGLKVVRTHEEIDALFESATREAIASFGRGECFVEKYLDKPRHVETQCLADQHNNVVVVSTRDCSLQRRHQKLVEEAPAPFLSKEQNQKIIEASIAIFREARYVGAGTCEFLIGNDSTVSFLEVNARLQVEHPVTEEITGIDLVREQFRIAEGEALEYTHPKPTGHSFEFRINGEDPGRSFLPAPGSINSFCAPSGPGIRVDTGVQSGDIISGAFDSLLAKLIVTGTNRQEALQRARRALDEFEITGIATVLPFFRVIVNDPAFSSAEADQFSVYTSWIETEWHNTLEPWSSTNNQVHDHANISDELVPIVVEVEGKRVEVHVPERIINKKITQRLAPVRKQPGALVAANTGNSITSPMQATVVKVLVQNEDEVSQGDLLMVLEAMKMEQPITAHKDGTVSRLNAPLGQTVSAGHLLMSLE